MLNPRLSKSMLGYLYIIMNIIKLIIKPGMQMESYIKVLCGC